MTPQSTLVASLAQSQQAQILDEWLKEAGRGATSGSVQSRQVEAGKVFDAFLEGVRGGADPERLDEPGWANLRHVLGELSAAHAAQGASSGDTSRFVLSLKKPFFARLQLRASQEAEAAMAALWWLSMLVDSMAQFTVMAYQQTRESIINRQQLELLELSTPVIKLWDGVLAVPMIGTLDSNRTQLVMEALLERIVDTGSELAIIDITGVPTVDTLVAQHLLKTVTAIRLMGAECIISGIRPQIAQTIVHLGIDLQGITTKATLADALSLALKNTGYVVSRPKS
ncbi:MAG: STAS domain-containing protein [Rubrivivax sp.]|nr:MAG: STAS domain-containing protein [Rubrivivax sp.]